MCSLSCCVTLDAKRCIAPSFRRTSTDLTCSHPASTLASHHINSPHLTHLMLPRLPHLHLLLHLHLHLASPVRHEKIDRWICARIEGLRELHARVLHHLLPTLSIYLSKVAVSGSLFSPRWKGYKGILSYGASCASWEMIPDTPWKAGCPDANFAGNWGHRNYNYCQTPWSYARIGSNRNL